MELETCLIVLNKWRLKSWELGGTSQCMISAWLPVLMAAVAVQLTSLVYSGMTVQHYSWGLTCWKVYPFATSWVVVRIHRGAFWYSHSLLRNSKKCEFCYCQKIIKLRLKIDGNELLRSTLSPSATMTCTNTSASKKSAYKVFNLCSWNLLDPVLIYTEYHQLNMYSMFGSRQKRVFCSTFDDIFITIGMNDVGCNYQPHPRMGFPW